jgi:hypothetical protein
MSGPNFVLLDATLPDVARLLIAMVQARDAVENPKSANNEAYAAHGLGGALLWSPLPPD